MLSLSEKGKWLFLYKDIRKHVLSKQAGINQQEEFYRCKPQALRWDWQRGRLKDKYVSRKMPSRGWLALIIWNSHHKAIHSNRYGVSLLLFHTSETVGNLVRAPRRPCKVFLGTGMQLEGCQLANPQSQWSVQISGENLSLNLHSAMKLTGWSCASHYLAYLTGLLWGQAGITPISVHSQELEMFHTHTHAPDCVLSDHCKSKGVPAVGPDLPWLERNARCARGHAWHCPSRHEWDRLLSQRQSGFPRCPWWCPPCCGRGWWWVRSPLWSPGSCPPVVQSTKRHC